MHFLGVETFDDLIARITAEALRQLDVIVPSEEVERMLVACRENARHGSDCPGGCGAVAGEG